MRIFRGTGTTMANSNTEHSKRLRAKTSIQWEKEKLASGEIAQLRLKTDTETIENFKALLSVFGKSRPVAMRNLVSWYNENKESAEEFLARQKSQEALLESSGTQQPALPLMEQNHEETPEPQGVIRDDLTIEEKIKLAIKAGAVIEVDREVAEEFGFEETALSLEDVLDSILDDEIPVK